MDCSAENAKKDFLRNELTTDHTDFTDGERSISLIRVIRAIRGHSCLTLHAFAREQPPFPVEAA